MGLDALIRKAGPEAEPFWEGVREGELRLLLCTHCKLGIFYPRAFCPYCYRDDGLQWQASEGLGQLYTFTEIFIGTDATQDRHWLALIELDEGVFLFGELEGDHEWEIGMPVVVRVVLREDPLRITARD